MNIKINSIKESIKNMGINYGRPIIHIDINKNEGVETGIEKIITLLNKNDFFSDYIYITGDTSFYQEEIISLIKRLIYKVEIVVDGLDTPKELRELTNLNFCVILDKDGRRIQKYIEDYKLLSEFKKAYFLFEIDSNKSLDKIEEEQDKYQLYPVYITFDDTIKFRDSIIRNSIKNGWYITPKLLFKE